MKKSNSLARICGGAVIAALLATPAPADEGMWTFDNFPAAAVRAKYDVNIDRAWLDHVRGAAVRLATGCSASIVSGTGLVLTNHHCVRSCAQDLSTDKADYIRDGFSALKREDEMSCPGMQAEVLLSTVDVTARIAAATRGKPPGEFKAALDAQIAAIEKDGCAGHETVERCEVITLYGGGRYRLYVYRKYTDVRLVFAPEAQMAFFGGDPDNFNFPRYDFDCAFVRLYENGAPVATPDHLIWRDSPPVEGETIFVAGNPGTTQRLLTAEQLESLRDIDLPNALLAYSELRGRLVRFAEESPDHRRAADDLLFGVENTFKSMRGQEQALVDPRLIAASHAFDAALRARVAKDPKLANEIGDPWSEIADAQRARKELNARFYFTERLAAPGSDLFAYGRAIVRAVEERTKPNGARLPEYGESRLPLIEKTVLDARPISSELEAAALEFWLSKLRENLRADSDATRTFLAGQSPELLAATLSKSQLSDPAYRKQLWDGGIAALTASNDPMIRFVLATDPVSRAIRKEYEDRVTNPTARAAERIARARFAVFGTRTYPDATFSLRLTYGKIEGWTDNGVAVPAVTRFEGLWTHATGQFPYQLAPLWAGAANAVDPKTIFDFVSDADIIGGNSGSPVIDAQGRVIGAIFDGNIESLGGAFGFDDSVQRAVAVSTAAITEALRNVYKNQPLVAELTGKPALSPVATEPE